MVLIFRGSNVLQMAVFLFHKRALLIHQTMGIKIFAEINFTNDSKFVKFVKFKTHEI